MSKIETIRDVTDTDLEELLIGRKVVDINCARCSNILSYKQYAHLWDG